MEKGHCLLTTALEHELRAGSRDTRANADQHPRVGDFRNARPEAVFLLAVLLEFRVFGWIFSRVALLLILFVLSRTC